MEQLNRITSSHHLTCRREEGLDFVNLQAIVLLDHEFYMVKA